MEYHNKLPKEGVNVSHEHPLRVLFKYLVGSAVLIVGLLVTLHLAGGYFAKKVPFAVEKEVMAALSIDFGTNSSPEMENYLSELSQRLARHMSVPDNMTFKVHYSDQPVFNAFATIGGNLLFYRGLLQRMPNENALAMVMAHELSHVLHRDPIAGAGIASMTALTLLLGNNDLASRFISWTGMATSMSFTRGMETAADKAAIAAVAAEYGHVEGADTLFVIIGEMTKESKLAANPDWIQRFNQTHPLDSDRIATIEMLAQQNGWPSSGQTTPLPDKFNDWLSAR